MQQTAVDWWGKCGGIISSDTNSNNVQLPLIALTKGCLPSILLHQLKPSFLWIAFVPPFHSGACLQGIAIVDFKQISLVWKNGRQIAFSYWLRLLYRYALVSCVVQDH